MGSEAPQHRRRPAELKKPIEQEAPQPVHRKRQPPPVQPLPMAAAPAKKRKKKKRRRTSRPGCLYVWVVLPVSLLVKGIGRQVQAFSRMLHRIPRQKKTAFMQSAAIVVLSVISLYCFATALKIMDRTRRTKETNASLVQMHEESRPKETPAVISELPENAEVFSVEPEATPEPTAVPQASPTPETTEPPAQKGPIVRNTQFHQFGGEPLDKMKALHERNHDLVAWLSIPDVLELPIVYRDNEYYLKRDFDKKPNEAGTLFLDEHHPFYEKAQNLLIHGHNMRDGTMFGRLIQYEESLDYLKGHAFINLDTLWESEQYVIFAVLHVPLDVKDDEFVAYYAHPTFASDAAFSSYIREVQLKSLYAIPMKILPSDALLTLSTCEGDDRLVILARKLRRGETRHEARQDINLAVRQ